MSANLRNILLNRNITPEQVAYLLGRPLAAVESWLQGSAMPEDSEIHRIAEIFGVSPASFYIDFAAQAPGDTWTISVTKLKELGLTVTRDAGEPIRIKKKREP